MKRTTQLLSLVLPSTSLQKLAGKELPIQVKILSAQPLHLIARQAPVFFGGLRSHPVCQALLWS